MSPGSYLQRLSEGWEIELLRHPAVLASEQVSSVGPRNQKGKGVLLVTARDQGSRVHIIGQERMAEPKT